MMHFGVCLLPLDLFRCNYSIGKVSVLCVDLLCLFLKYSNCALIYIFPSIVLDGVESDG